MILYATVPLVLVLDDRRVPLDRALLLGAETGCDVVIAGLSAKHARFEPGEEWVLVRSEAGSAVAVNEVGVADGEARALLPGDRVRIGPAAGKVAYEETVVPAKTAELALAALNRARNAPRVTVVAGPALGAHVDLQVEGQPVRVGRTRDCDWVIDDDTLSRGHVRLVLRGGGVLVRDLESARGTFMGAARLEPQKDAPWDPRCSLRIGRTVLTLRMPIALDEAVAHVVEQHGAAEEPEQPSPPRPPPEEAPSAPAEVPAPAPVARAPRGDAPLPKPTGSSKTPIVVALGSAFILACILVLLWIFGVFART